MTDLHFLRPAWLLLLFLLPLLLWALRHGGIGDSGWSRWIPRHLLTPLVRSRDDPASRHPVARRVLPAIAWISLSLALAGPAWREAPTPLKHPGDSLVIVLDLSLSMLATDVEPDRLTQAKRKIRDILDARAGSLNALVVYAADSHVVTPLTDDARTIEAMLAVLDPVIMPAQGNRADLAVAQARALLAQGAPGPGRILLISDGVDERYRAAIHDQLQDGRYPLDTLVVGTEQGGPIPLAKRGFIRDNGNIVMTRADAPGLARLARDNGGHSHALTLDDGDIQALALRAADGNNWQDANDLTVARWQDDGYWLLWLAAPLLLLGWRRGMLAGALMLMLPLAPQPAQAAGWDSLWLRDDQRAPALIEQDPAQAARELTQPEWKATALYRAGRYDQAAQLFGTLQGPDADYNRGNALAQAGRLEDAIKAYDSALAQDPEMEDARYNRALVEQLLRQRRQPSQQGQGQGQTPNPGDDREHGQSSPDRQGQDSQSDRNAGPTPGHTPPNGDPEPSRDNAGQAPQPSQETAEPPPPPEPDTGHEQQPGKGREDGAEAPDELSTVPLSQAQEQWLRRIPDNPGGLLRRKFLQQYQERQTPPDEGDTPW
jgi:Ca-activated chloride channel family protein